jgi:hypothetical protein
MRALHDCAERHARRLLRAESERTGQKVSLEYRLDDYLHCHLYHSVFHRRDAQWPGLPRLSGLRDVHPSHQRYPILPASQFLFEFVQKPCFAVIPNRVDVYLIHARRPFIGLHPLPGFLQNVLSTDLIVEKREPPSRLLLGHSV